MITQLAGVCSTKCLRYSTCSYVTAHKIYVISSCAFGIFHTFSLHNWMKFNLQKLQSIQPITVMVNMACHSHGQHGPSQSKSIQPISHGQYGPSQWRSIRPVTVRVNMARHSHSQYGPSQSRSIQPITVTVNTARHSDCQYGPSQSRSIWPITVTVNMAHHRYSQYSPS
jgi:hypothetical protein